MPFYRLKPSAVPAGVKKIRLEIGPNEVKYLAAGEVFEGSPSWRMWLKTHLVEIPDVKPAVEVVSAPVEPLSVEVAPVVIEEITGIGPEPTPQSDPQPDPQPEAKVEAKAEAKVEPQPEQPEEKAEEQPAPPVEEGSEIREVVPTAPVVTEVKPETPRRRRLV